MTALMTEHLPLVASADQGTALLRKAILGLAIRGLLDSQDDTDEPAGALLERAAALKPSKPARLTSASEAVASVPFELPRGWVWTTLPALAVINPRNQADDDGEASFVPMAAIGTGFADGHSQETRRWGDIKTGFTHFAEGDIGVAKITPCFENGKACVFSGVINGIGAGTTELHVVRPLGGTLAPRYVLAYLKSPWFLDNGESKMTGTAGQKRLPKDFVERHPFPLPPLAEQHRIVAKVDELMALCDRLEARQQDAEAAHARLVQALLDSLTQARDADEFQACWQQLAGEFQTLFSSEASVDRLGSAILSLAVSGRLVTQHSGDEPATQLLLRLDADTHDFCVQQKAPRAQVLPVSEDEVPFEAPSGWVWARLGSLFRVITDGDHQAPPQTSEGVAFLTIGNVTNGYLDFEHSRSVEPSYFAALAPYRKPAIGDLLYTVVGATYGRPVLVETDRPFCVQRHIAILKRSDFLCAKFALYLLKSPLVYDQASANTTGTAQPTIPLKPLRNLLVPLPPLAEQHRIVAKITELLTLCDQLKARIVAARAKHAQLAEALVAQAIST